MKRTEYVVGFYMNGDEVLLIEKQRPERLKGLYNGIGGQIEEGEEPLTAMVREFEEETGVLVDGGFVGNRWALFCRITRENTTLWFYRADARANEKPFTQTDELVMWWPVHALNTHQVLPNVRWLVPMAGQEQAPDWVYDVTERRP